MRPAKLIVLICMLAAVGFGCGPGGSSTPTPPALGPVTILSPQDGETFDVNTTIPVELRGVSYVGIQQFEVKTSDGQSWYAAPTLTNSGSGSGTRFFVEITWIPDTPGTYTVQARATDATLNSTPWTEIHVVVVDILAAPATVVTPAVIQFSPSPTPTILIFTASAVMNANCRAGPGTTFNETGFVSKGSTVEVAGRNEDETWLNVVNPNGDGNCWASIIAFEIPFEMKVLPVKASAPAPPAPSSGGEGGGGPAPQGCFVTNPFTGQKQCESPCPQNARPGGACTP